MIRPIPVRCARVLALTWLLASTLPALPARATDGPPLPSPVRILNRRELDAPFLDAVSLCVPGDLEDALEGVVEKAAEGDWKAALHALEQSSASLERHSEALIALTAELKAREATTRDARRAADLELQGLIQDPAQKNQQACLRLERARLLMLLQRTPEASAELTRVADDLVGESVSARDRARLAGIAFSKAEILYRMGRRFDAHMAYRKIAGSENPRLALAARLRLSDLSFDVGKTDPASLEYETLLPRATAFGASLDGWSLRAAEAALAAGDASRSLHWLERFSDVSHDRDARDVAEIRRAELELRLADPVAASNRLMELRARHKDDPIGSLAAVRAIDLGVFAGTPAEKAEVLGQTIRRHRYGLRRYALDVLIRDLVSEDAPDRAIAVATRLAYEGIDPAVVPGYTATLDRLLARVMAGGDASCEQTVRALGGRYAILIERSSSWGPFAQLGRCFERMEVAWLAVPVYRAISRRFGTQGASAVALPLARASLANGEVALARHLADAALEQTPAQSAPWQAIVAEAEFREGRSAFAVKRAREILDATDLELQRSQLVLSLARSLEKSGSLDDARFVAARVPGWLDAPHGETPSADRVRLLEAALLTAHVLRRADVDDASFALYRAIDRNAAAGPLRSSARFWLGLARQADEGDQRAWDLDVLHTLGPPWAPVAAFEEHFESLRDVYAGVLR